jgi:hypothetical protein
MLRVFSAPGLQACSSHLRDPTVDHSLQILRVGIVDNFQACELLGHGCLDVGLLGDEFLETLELLFVGCGSTV